MISVLFVSAILAQEGSMVAAVSQSINIGVIFAENLEITLSLSNNTFDNIIFFYRHSLLCIDHTVIFGLATGAFIISLQCDSSLLILWTLDHFSSDTLSTSSVSAAYHHYRFSRREIEPMLAVEAIQLDRHLYYIFLIFFE
jgi:hypothetical protein